MSVEHADCLFLSVVSAEANSWLWQLSQPKRWIDMKDLSEPLLQQSDGVGATFRNLLRNGTLWHEHVSCLASNKFSFIRHTTT